MLTGPDTRIGSYAVEREIGRGGMGVVYLARDTRLNRAVAIKALPAAFASDPMRLERFEREARALAQVHHPNIAGIHGVEEHDGQRFLVLEYVGGETLADRLDRGPIEPDEAVEIACQIASGVAAAHDVGVVHRDLKPANVRVTPDGVAKVLDFGLARYDEDQSSTGSSEAATLTSPVHHSPTVPGVILGTAAYMSPEQARGRRVDKRTDIWSFGVLLYEMLTGSCPFRGETATDSIGAILHKDPDFGRLPASTPTHVRRVLARCLERDRNQRFRDIGDVKIELENGDSEAESRATGWSAGRVALAAIAAAVLAGAAGLAAGWLLAPVPPAREMRLSVAPPAQHAVRFAGLSADGRRVVMGTAPLDGSGETEIHMRWLDRPELVPVPGARRTREGAPSPDGSWISMVAPIGEDGATMQLVKMPASLDLPPAPLTALPESVAISGYNYLWLSDERFVFADGRTNQVRFVDAQSGSISEPVKLDLGSYPGSFNRLIRRVDDDRALCNLFKYTDRGFEEDIALVDLRARTVTPILENSASAAIGPDGSLLFTRGSTLYGATLDQRTLEVGPAVPLAAGLRTMGPGSDAIFDLSSDGTILYLPGGDQGGQRRIEFHSPGGGREVWPVEPRPFSQGLTVSRDGSRMLTIVVSPGALYEIWGSEMESPRLRRVRGIPRADLNYPVFGPDHDSFAYMFSEGDRTGVQIASFDGRFEPRTILPAQEEGFLAPLSFHPDGTRLLILWERPEGFRLYEVQADGTGAPRLVIGNDSNQSFSDYSPDGSMLAYTSDETGRREAYVRTIGADGSLGRPVAVTTRGATAVQWWLAPDAAPGTDKPNPEVLQLAVLTRDGISSYPIRPGPRPDVGEEREMGYDRSVRTVGAGHVLSDGRLMTVTPGENETPATHVELILNWYDDAARLIRGE